MIAFDYDGDIWTVPSTGGEANRLTIHLANERRPYFSPDGNWILYTAAYHRNYDLYIMPSKGGEPRRLTYSPGSEIPSGWSNDGKHCYFYAFLDKYYDIFRIPFEGGSSARLASSTRESLIAPNESPDGKKIAFNYRSGFNHWDRRKNVSPNTADIYIADNTVPVTNVVPDGI